MLLKFNKRHRLNAFCAKPVLPILLSIASLSVSVLVMLPVPTMPPASAAPLEGNVNHQDGASTGEQKVYRQTGMSGNLETSLGHPDKLAAVMNQFRLGADFSEADRARFKCRAQWFRLPAWLTGKWHCEQANDEIKTDNLSQKTTRVELAARRAEDRTVIMGHQQDLTRQIWHFICIPFTALVAYEKDDPVVLVPLEVSMQQFPNATPWRVVLNERFMAIQLKHKPVSSISSDHNSDNAEIDINSEAEEITGVTQHDVVIAYTCVSKTGIGIEASERIYDDKGGPLSTVSATHTYKKESDFNSINRIDDLDLSKLFAEFLNSNGMADRVPKVH